TTTNGARANCAGSASTKGKMTNEFLVTALKVTARRADVLSLAARGINAPRTAMMAAKATYSGTSLNNEPTWCETPEICEATMMAKVAIVNGTIAAETPSSSFFPHCVRAAANCVSAAASKGRIINITKA